MAGDITLTGQSGIHSHRDQNLTKHSLFMGGLNTKNAALQQYTPLKTGYARIFVVRMPKFMTTIAPNMSKRFKHMLEYGFTGVDGIQNTTLEFDQVTGGYVGRSFDTAVNAKDDTSEITIKLYEFSGSPLREYVDLWLTGIIDPQTGLCHYHGAIDMDVPMAQHNHTMEMIFVNTDPTGRSDGIEHVAMFTNMMPKEVKKDHFNFEAGQHNVTQVDLSFTAVKYESPQINMVGAKLLDKYKVLRNYLYFHSDFDVVGDNITEKGQPSKIVSLPSEISDWDDKFAEDLNNRFPVKD